MAVTLRAGYAVGADGMHSTDWIPAVHHTLAMNLSELSVEHRRRTRS